MSDKMWFEDNETDCLICGEDACGYLLCRDCYREYKGQKIQIEIDVGPQMERRLIKNPSREDENKKCLLCQNESGKYLFCKSCFPKYMNKTLLLKIAVTNNQKIDLLDESYEGIYECDDGHIVKSTIEQAIDNWLFEKGIKHGYEIPLDVGADKPIRPDFCLKDFFGNNHDLYLEYFGMKGDADYDQKTAYKMNIYKKKKISVLCLYPNRDSKNIKFALQKYLINERNSLKANRVNFEE